jgi:hypothetical protein
VTGRQPPTPKLPKDVFGFDLGQELRFGRQDVLIFIGNLRQDQISESNMGSPALRFLLRAVLSGGGEALLVDNYLTVPLVKPRGM